MAGQPYRLSRGEYELIRRMSEKGIEGGYLDEVAEKLSMDKASLSSLVMLLSSKNLAVIGEDVEPKPQLTEKGLQAVEEGLPEERLVKLLVEHGGRLSLEAVRSRLGSDSGVAVGQAKGKGYITITGGVVELTGDPEGVLDEIMRVKSLLEKVRVGVKVEVPGDLVKRGLVKVVEVKRQWFKLNHPPRAILEKSVVEVAKLSASLLSSGQWRRVELRSYDVTASPPRVRPARKHFLVEFIEMLRNTMKELGFVEVRGPIVEIELFNFDVLFQAQDHPAREIHDTLWIKEPSQADISAYGDLVERVAVIHEKGWGYRWSPEIAARHLLRSQTTSVSARVLSQRPQPPIRYFTIGRVYRSDVVDATHLPEFHQLDGIMGWPGFSFRDLIGVLREVAVRLGLELKLKPGYFPFTEPSVEGYVQLPNGRWLELFGAGLFRPEVLEAAGVDYPVGAWGLGVERFAAAVLGLSDIRDLYTSDVERIAGFKVRLV